MHCTPHQAPLPGQTPAPGPPWVLASTQPKPAWLVSLPAGCFAASEDAHHELGSGLARVGPLGSAPGLSKLVAVQFGNIAVHKNFATAPIRWPAAGPRAALFPVLDADIILTRAGPGVSILEVRGVHRPPLSRLGARLDQVVLHRVAQPTIRSFTHRIGTAITDPAAETAPINLVLDLPVAAPA